MAEKRDPQRAAQVRLEKNFLPLLAELRKGKLKQKTLRVWGRALSRYTLMSLKRAYVRGHGEAVRDVVLYCTRRKLRLPGWALKACVGWRLLRGDTPKQKGRHSRFAQRQKQFVLDSARFAVVELCRNRRYQKRHDKFEQAFALLAGSWFGTKDSTGIKKSYYRFKRMASSGEYYLSPSGRDAALRALATMAEKRSLK